MSCIGKVSNFVVKVSEKEVIICIVDVGKDYRVELVNEDVGLSYYFDSYPKKIFDNEDEVLEYVITETDGFGNLTATFLKTCEIFERLLIDNKEYLATR